MAATTQRLVVWASGMIEFLGDKPEPEGALTVCVARGDEAIEHLFECVLHDATLYDFGGRVALKVPDIDPERDDTASGIDPAIDALISWGDWLRDQIDPSDPDFEWTRN